MIERIKNIIARDDFIKNNIIFFTGSMIVAVLNYLYHPILSRLMSVEDFGEVQTLISIFLQISVALGIFGNIVVNLTANSSEKFENLAIINQLYKIALFSSFILAIGIIVFAPFLKGFLNFHATLSFWALAISLPLGISLTFRRFFLQGKREFTKVSAVNIFYAGGRLLFAVSLVWLGMAVFGAIIAIALATVVSLVYAYYYTKKDFGLSLKQPIIFDQTLKEEFKYGGLVLATTGFVTFLYTADMVFVKHYFSPEVAGFYGGISTIARIVFFVTGSVVAVLVASVKIKEKFQKNVRVLLKGIVIITLIGASVAGAFVLFPDLVIKLMIGSRYLKYVYLLPKMAILLFLVSLTNLMFMFFLALRRYFIIRIALFGGGLTSLLSVLNHDSVMSIVNNFLVGVCVVIILLVYQIIKFNKAECA